MMALLILFLVVFVAVCIVGAVWVAMLTYCENVSVPFSDFLHISVINSLIVTVLFVLLFNVFDHDPISVYTNYIFGTTDTGTIVYDDFV